jgi:hypothetical protein
MRKALIGILSLAALGLVGCGSSSSNAPDSDVGKGPMTSPRPTPNASGGAASRPAPAQTGMNEG